MNSNQQDNKNKIVILFLIDFLVTKEGVTGGAERQLLEKINKLDRDKFTPILLCLQESSQLTLWDELDCEKGLLHIHSIMSFDCFFKVLKFRKFLKRRKVDIVESVFFDSIFVGVITARLAGVKKVVTCRRDMGFWYSRLMLKWFLFFNCLTDSILVNSNAIKKFVGSQERVSSDKIDVICNGIDLDRFESTGHVDLLKEYPNIKKCDKIVGIVGNCNRHVKRFDLFVMGISEVVKHNKDVKFVVVGDGKLKHKIMSLADKLNVKDYLIWVGRKNNPIPYVKNFSIGVITSDSEGFCNAILEYMAAGLPVVATNVGGNPELVDDGKSGFLVPADDQHAFADRILQLLSDEELASKMGLEGARLVRERYSWDAKVKEYEAFYQRLVGQDI